MCDCVCLWFQGAVVVVKIVTIHYCFKCNAAIPRMCVTRLYMYMFSNSDNSLLHTHSEHAFHSPLTEVKTIFRRTDARSNSHTQHKHTHTLESIDDNHGARRAAGCSRVTSR